MACRRSIFFLRFWALEGDVSRRLPPKSCKVVHADSTNPEPGWHHSWILKNALKSDWCQSSGTKGIKLCLLDVKPQSFLFTQWHLQFVKAPGLSTTPCPTISFCFLFLENERVPFFVTSTFSLWKENIWLSHLPLRLRKQGINGSRVQIVNLVLEQQSRTGGGWRRLTTWLLSPQAANPPIWPGLYGERLKVSAFLTVAGPPSRGQVKDIRRIQPRVANSVRNSGRWMVIRWLLVPYGIWLALISKDTPLKQGCFYTN